MHMVRYGREQSRLNSDWRRRPVFRPGMEGDRKRVDIETETNEFGYAVFVLPRSWRFALSF